MRKVLAEGVDISEFNGDVDIQRLKEQGVGFVIIRCGFGSDFPEQDDEYYAANVKKCIEAKMPFGVYLYAYAANVNMALSEAEHTLRLLKGFPKPEYGVWYDVEDRKLPNDGTLPKLCALYCKKIQEAGYQAGVYTFLSWLEDDDYLGGFHSDSRLAPYGLWLAQFNDVAEYAHPERVDIWQYTDKGTYNGARFDKNHAYTRFPKKI